MVGATVVTLAGGSVAGALMPFAVAVLVLFVAYGRWSTLAVASGIEGPADFVPRSTN
jgi:hypothetical protein